MFLTNYLLTRGALLPLSKYYEAPFLRVADSQRGSLLPLGNNKVGTTRSEEKRGREKKKTVTSGENGGEKRHEWVSIA